MSKEELEARIADAETRNSERAPEEPDADAVDAELEKMEGGEDTATLGAKTKEAGAKATDFVKRHPFAVVGGALAVGALVSLALPKSKTRKASVKIGKDVHEKSLAYGALIAELALTYSKNFLEAYDDAKKASQEKLEDAVEEAGTVSRHAKSAAMRTARDAGKKAIRLKRKLSK